MRWGTVARLAAIPVIISALLGAEQGGCNSTTGSVNGGQGGQAEQPQGKTYGQVIGGRCTQRVAEAYASGGRVWGYADATCREAVLNHSLTVILDKRGPGGGWDEVSRNSNHLSPGKGALKKVETSVSCQPGFYRVRMKATVEALKDPDGPDSGGAETPGAVVSKEQC
ncbi:hypothetical protein OG883_27505 [Streptomyces sp. NBC_01142]|uniref:hypothetical protein n=1 Tax=Streptomyces sp. NBC_01142 TaxID=2975865 RepID=UPI00225A5180|nr:hypothetical protein [Streptomyces sp. NBC_01142]MCX4823556.1 hypothetical protein [Streptomyces sp. NBC_01142]